MVMIADFMLKVAQRLRDHGRVISNNIFCREPAVQQQDRL